MNTDISFWVILLFLLSTFCFLFALALLVNSFLPKKNKAWKVGKKTINKIE